MVVVVNGKGMVFDASNLGTWTVCSRISDVGPSSVQRFGTVSVAEVLYLDPNSARDCNILCYNMIVYSMIQYDITSHYTD